MKELETLSKAISSALDACPAEDVLCLLTGHWVGLTLDVVRLNGGDETTSIQIDGGEARDITIHPPKGGAG